MFLQQIFDIPNTEVGRKKVLSNIVTKWTGLKTFLTREDVFRKHKDESPYVKYHITKEELDAVLC